MPKSVWVWSEFCSQTIFKQFWLIGKNIIQLWVRYDSGYGWRLLLSIIAAVSTCYLYYLLLLLSCMHSVILPGVWAHRTHCPRLRVSLHRNACWGSNSVRCAVLDMSISDHKLCYSRCSASRCVHTQTSQCIYVYFCPHLYIPWFYFQEFWCLDLRVPPNPLFIIFNEIIIMFCQLAWKCFNVTVYLYWFCTTWALDNCGIRPLRWLHVLEG